MKKKIHDLFIRIPDKSQQPFLTQFGWVTPSKWIKAEGDINCGSLAKPNKDILEFKWVPISDNKDEYDELLKRLFGRLFRG